MTAMELQESAGVMQTSTSSELVEQNNNIMMNTKPMHSVEIAAETDNDVSSSGEDNLDPKLSMNESVNTAESTLPMSMSDDSINSSQYDHGSPISTKLETPQTPQKQQQRELPLSPRISQRTLDSTPQTPNSTTSQTPKKPLSKAQSIRDRRRMMEAWHDEQKSKAAISMRSVTSTASSFSEQQQQRPQSFTSQFSPKKKLSMLGKSASSRKNLLLGNNNNNKKRKGTKEEMARYSRMVDRIVYAEKEATNRIRSLSRHKEDNNKAGDARDRMLCLRERAELKLRLSQMEKARDFYQGLISSNTVEAIPMEVLKTINDLPNYQPKKHMSLTEELEAYVKSVQKEDPEEAGYMFQEIRDWKDSEDLALEVGAVAPDFVLTTSQQQQQQHQNNGSSSSKAAITIDSKALRQQWRMILVFYHDYDSPMCKMNLMALQALNKTFEREGAKLVAIGFEADTTDTAEETEVTFPLLADDVGILATKFGIIRGEELPILSTFIIDHDGTILWRYVNTDYTKRPEPMDILEALPEKSSSQSHNSSGSRRKLFFRKPSQKKR